MAWGSGSSMEGAGWDALCRLTLLGPRFLVANADSDPRQRETVSFGVRPRPIRPCAVDDPNASADSGAGQASSVNPFSFGAATRMRAGRSATPF